MASSFSSRSKLTEDSRIVKERIVNLANELLDICNTDTSNRSSASGSFKNGHGHKIPKKFTQSINSIRIFMYLCTKTFAALNSLKCPVKSFEDEVHNIQAIVDSLSMDILHEDLSHLTGEAICEPDLVSVEYLLDILKCINEWVASRLESTLENTNSPKCVETNLSSLANQNLEEKRPSSSNSNYQQLKESSNSNLIDSKCETPTVNSKLSKSETSNRKNEERNLSADIRNSKNVERQSNSDFKKSTENQQKYIELDRKVQETIEMAKNALKNPLINKNETKSNILQKKDLNNYNLLNNYQETNNEFDEDLFKNYMKKKEEEYQMNKKNKEKTTTLIPSLDKLNLKTLRESESKAKKVIKSSSGNSSLGSCSSRSSMSGMSAEENNSTLNDDILSDSFLNNLNTLNSQPSVKRHVRFEKSKLRPRSLSRNSLTSSNQSSSRRPTQNQHQSRDMANYETIDTELKSIRSNINQNRLKEQNKAKYLLESVFNDDFKDAESIMRQSLNKIKNRSDLTNELYLSAFGSLKSKDKTSPKAPTKSNLIVTNSSKSKGVLLPSSKSLTTVRSASCDRMRQSRRSSPVSSETSRSSKRFDLNSKTRDPSREFLSRFTIGEDGILNMLLQEFPYLYTSPETIHYLWEKHAKQIESFSKIQKEIENKYINPKVTSSTSSWSSKLNLSDDETSSLNSFTLSSRLKQNNPTNQPKAQVYLQECYRRQQMLMDIMRKDLTHLQRMQDMKRKREVENSLKARMREQRFQNAKIKRYYEEFTLQQRAKMLKKATSEELIFKQLFNESIKIQKERMLDLKRYAKEKSEFNNKIQMNQIESIENFYKNKFDLLNEKMKNEKEQDLIREKAQHFILTKMKSQVKQKLESDIKDLQGQMVHDKDYLYWRELDARRVKNEICSANYYKTGK